MCFKSCFLWEMIYRQNNFSLGSQNDVWQIYEENRTTENQYKLCLSNTNLNLDSLIFKIIGSKCNDKFEMIAST